MNERIKELAGQAKCMAEETINKQISKNAELDAFAEKFARLILTEVTDILSTYRGKIIFVDGFEYNCDHPIVAIRKHFGVEL